MVEGYLHPTYTDSFYEIGTPVFLPRSKGWLIKRPIPASEHFDAMGCYPLFLCENWNSLPEDINNLEDELVSVALVTDPFMQISYEQLKEIFPVCYHYKDHYLTDFSIPLEKTISKKTRKLAARALRDIVVERCQEPIQFLDEWVDLYDVLIKRHNITGIRAFSRDSFSKLLSIPGLDLFIARLGDEIVGAEIIIQQGIYGYAHLVAVSELGYEQNATYALDWTALKNYSNSLRFMDHGSGAGLDNEENGLVQYKKRWATVKLPVYFCGRILNERTYRGLCDHKSNDGTGYFPLYRAGELNPEKRGTTVKRITVERIDQWPNQTLITSCTIRNHWGGTWDWNCAMVWSTTRMQSG